MPHAAGDPEWLYNVPGRPVFGPFGAVAFWLGVVLATWAALHGLIKRKKKATTDYADFTDSRRLKSMRTVVPSFPSAFVLILSLIHI